MAVSRIAVMALVAVIAVPILLGYALNLTETTETGYGPAGDAVNVTELLQTGTSYTYAHADYYQLNTNFKTGAHATYPDYAVLTGAKTSFKSNIALVTDDIIYTGAVVPQYTVLSYVASYKMSEGNITMYYLLNDNTTGSVSYFQSLDYNSDTNEAKITYYVSDGHISTLSLNNLQTIQYFTKTGTINGYMYVVYNDVNEGVFIDLSSGFYIINSQETNVVLPANTRSYMFTMDLNTITDPTFSMRMSSPGGFLYDLEKSTDGGGNVSWLVRDVANPSRTIDLYYDQSRSSNTYQIYSQLNKLREEYDYDYYSTHTEFRYVGNWPSLIGEANYYLKIEDDVGTRITHGTNLNMDYVSFYNITGYKSPLIRFDDAYFRAFEYSAITDQTYQPSSFRSNPATTITNITHYGDKLTFGGTTYTVNKGNITIDGRDLPIDKLTFMSVPDGNGSYENRIGNTVISTTAQPSVIKFGGSWSASVSTQSMQSQTNTKTEWNAGSFAWDGMDNNFLIVGLITCLGAFIGLGIYARKSRSGGIIPLMIVTGCAAAVFFIML